MSLSVFLEYIPECILLINPSSDRIEFCNQRCVALLQLTNEQISTKRASALFSTCLPQFIKFTQQVDYVGEAIAEDLCIDVHDQQLSVEVVARAIIMQGQRLLCFLLRDQEHGHRRRLQVNTVQSQKLDFSHGHCLHDALQRIEKVNHLILSAAGEGIYGIDADGNTTFVNPAAERLLGFRTVELVGKNIHEAIHHTHHDGSGYSVQECPIYAAFKDGEVRFVDNEVFWTKLGKPFPVEYTSTPILDNGHLVGAVVVFRDISERREADAKLQQALVEVKQLKKRLELENAYLQEEISAGYNAYQIIGNSLAIKQILHQIQLVAPTTATVLITGESGTGKELIARAIHTASERHQRPLVRVNCAAIPADLFESEFFGHARGAFSGAVQDRQGRFQVADGGTLFLDEVGEIPLALQSKLLRVLQDREFERVGESMTRTVNVRVIAATNRDLKQLVQEGKFREDLYFRLNVFPLHSVALRHRRSDIPLLITHFLKKTCQRFNKPELTVSMAQMQQLESYDWPGNIRELSNLIERQVILSRGGRLLLDHLTLSESNGVALCGLPAEHNQEANALTESECGEIRRQAMERALKKTKGKLYGDDGAAFLLGIKPTTLASRLKKMGIDRRLYC